MLKSKLFDSELLEADFSGRLFSSKFNFIPASGRAAQALKRTLSDLPRSANVNVTASNSFFTAGATSNLLGEGVPNSTAVNIPQLGSLAPSASNATILEAALQALPPLEREISVNFNGFSVEAQRAFQRAVDIWDSYLDLDVPIVIDAFFEDLGGIDANNSAPLGFAGTTGFVELSGGGLPGTVNSSFAQANQILGFDFNGEASEITAVFNSNSDVNFFFGDNGDDIGSDQFDFTEVVLHEISHGLGLLSSFSVDDTGIGSFFEAAPLLFDLFVENGAGEELLDFTNNSIELGNALTGNDLFFDGTNVDLADLSLGGGNANSGNGNERPELFAPSEFIPGSSVIHLDETAFPFGSVDSVFTPAIGLGESVQDLGPVSLGLIDDLGYTLASPIEQIRFETLAQIEADLIETFGPTDLA